jgi:transposase
VDDWKRSFHTAERDVNLESSDRLTPLEALNMYRSRATVEHLVHFPKHVAGLEPLRVWKEDSIGDAMLSALMAETAIAMAGYEMETKKGTKGG